MDTMQFAKSMSFQEFERKFSYLLPWEEAEKKAGRRLDSYNNFDCCLYHDLLMGAVKEKLVDGDNLTQGRLFFNGKYKIEE